MKRQTQLTLVKINLLAILLFVFTTLANAQIDPNQPPSDSPFSESEKNIAPDASAIRTAIVLEPALLLRGLGAVSLHHTPKKIPLMVKIGYGVSFDRDFLLGVSEALFDAKSLGVRAIQDIRTSDQARFNYYMFRIGYKRPYLGQLRGISWNLHYSFGDLNADASVLPEFTIRGTQNLFYKTQSFGASIGYIFTRNNGIRPNILWGFDLGASFNKFMINKSVQDRLNSYVYDVSSETDVDTNYGFTFSLFFGLGW